MSKRVRKNNYLYYSPHLYDGGGFFDGFKAGVGNLNMKGLGEGLGGSIGAIGSAVGGAVGGLISNGLESKAGSLFNTIGNIGSAIPGPWGAIIGGGAKVVGGLVNAAFGTKVDQEKLNAANQGTNYLNNFRSTASYFDDIQGPQTQLAVEDAYKGGWFSKGKARKRNAALREQRLLAQSFANRSVENNIENIADEQMDTMLANYAAFGGPLHTHGADWTNGITVIGNGGSHESSPFEGVPMGIAPDGQSNLVEEGEVIFNNYVFSNRLKVPKAVREKYKLRGQKDMTFADAAKKVQKESEERPNDPISQKGLEAVMYRLMGEQEVLRQRKQDRQYAEGGSINIKPSKRGTFTAAASKHNMGVQEFASKVLANPEDYSPAMRKKANFARNASKWKHSLGGILPHKFALGGPHFGDDVLNWYNGMSDDEYDALLSSIYPPSAIPGRFKGNRAALLNEAYSDNEGSNHIYDIIKRNHGFNNLSEVQVKGGWTYPSVLDHPTSDINRRLFPRITLSQPSVFNIDNIRNTASKDYGYELRDSLFQNAKGTLFDQRDEGQKLIDNWSKLSGIGKNESGNYTTMYRGANSRLTMPEREEIVDDENVRRTQPGALKSWLAGLRYVPAIGAGIGVFSDLMGWTNKPDYSNADSIVDAASNIGDVRYSSIGDYIRYAPLDRLFYVNQLGAQAGATRRNILNTSGGNRGAAMAGLLASDYNAQGQLGNLFRQAEEYNLGQRERVATFNRGTNMFNAENNLQAQIANRDRDRIRVEAAIKAAMLRDQIDTRVSAAKSANLTNLFNSLGDIGREAFTMNMVMSNPALYYSIDRKTGNIIYKNGFDDLSEGEKAQVRKAAERASKSKSHGGYLTIKRRK